MKYVLAACAVLALLINAAHAETSKATSAAPATQMTSDQERKADCLARIKKLHLKVPHPKPGVPPPRHCEAKNGVACGVPVGCEWMLFPMPKHEPLPQTK